MEVHMKESHKVTANVDNNEKAETMKITTPTTITTTTTTKSDIIQSAEVKNVMPTLGQIGRQVSLNLRHSQLSDSGAESCDNEEQSRLIRTPSTRSHKFIIIPAKSLDANAKTATSLRQTISTSALSAMATAIQHKPPLSVGATRNKQRPLSTASTSSTFKLLRELSGNVSDADIENTTKLNSNSADLLHQAQAASTVVRFTLDEESRLIAVDTISTNNEPLNDTSHASTTNKINSTPLISKTLSSSTLKCAEKMTSNMPKNEQLRSAASANALSANDFLQPTTYFEDGRKDLSASACLFPEQLPKQIYSDLTSVRSLASIGIGSTDGRRLVIRRVPTTPNELFSLVHPPSPR